MILQAGFTAPEHFLQLGAWLLRGRNKSTQLCRARLITKGLKWRSVVAAVRGGARIFRLGGLILPTKGLKYGFQGTINAKNFRKIALHLPTGG